MCLFICNVDFPKLHAKEYNNSDIQAAAAYSKSTQMRPIPMDRIIRIPRDIGKPQWTDPRMTYVKQITVNGISLSACHYPYFRSHPSYVINMARNMGFRIWG